MVAHKGAAMKFLVIYDTIAKLLLASNGGYAGKGNPMAVYKTTAGAIAACKKANTRLITPSCVVLTMDEYNAILTADYR